MSSFKEKLINALTSKEDGFELVDVKFALGTDRYISEEKFCEQVFNGLSEVKSKKTPSVSPSIIDGNFTRQTIEQFLA